MDLFWLEPSLAVVTRPDASSLSEELGDLRDAGIDLLVSCLMPDEEALLGLQEEAALARAAGLDFQRVTIIDGSVPDDVVAFERAVDALARERREGRRVAIHCRASVGRAPLVAAALLTEAGMDAHAAVRLIAERRRHTIMDTDEQRAWVPGFADRRAKQRATGSTDPVVG